MLKMRYLLLFLYLLPIGSFAQTPRIKNKKYQGLLWEISGNGLQKPSYLFGTMHVSSKLAFHLADSFYLGIKGADVVALETNPETWQADMEKYNRAMTAMADIKPEKPARIPQRYMREDLLKFFPYEKRIEDALQSSPSTINSLLYRSYGNDASDFEEDTYLDMYIYQCGKKWGKKVAGVEDYDESMKLMAEAYRDAARDKNKKPRFYDRESGFTNDRLQESYRTGNLDWLDSINYYNSNSAAFDEKFLYQRNEIQANSIDSIIKSGSSLFVGVGAAHLPGERGVIELLRSKGYQLRPVTMGTRDSEHKSQVEKLRVPVVFRKWKSADGQYEVDVPGELFAFGDQRSGEQRQYADMANGSYYIVTRIMTNAWMWNHPVARVKHIVDSLLYENIPGKIVSKKEITRNGHPGYDIVNKTRRGDMQRYQIFVTGFEVIIFKMSGTGEYVAQGTEADHFFSSIELKPTASTASSNWVPFTPTFGGFKIYLPHLPYQGNDGSWIYDAVDGNSSTEFRLVRSVIPNYFFAEEDSFDLGLMDESFASSEFIEKRTSRKSGTYRGLPSLDVEYRDKAGKWLGVRFLIQGSHYYTLVARASKSNSAAKRFLTSFETMPFRYGPSTPRVDTLLYYSVSSPVFPELDSSIAQMPVLQVAEEDPEEIPDIKGALNRSRLLVHDSTGEMIFVAFQKQSPYESIQSGTQERFEWNSPFYHPDSSWLVRKKEFSKTNDGYQLEDWWLSDAGSSRLVRMRKLKRGDITYALTTELDTSARESSFIHDFFSSFQPVDTFFSFTPEQKKAALFFQDLFSADSVDRKRAREGIEYVILDSSHLPQLKLAIKSLDWKEKDYQETKENLIEKAGSIKSAAATDLLVSLFREAGDTTSLQNAVLEALLQQQTSYSYQHFRDIVTNEPPIINENAYNRSYTNFSYSGGGSAYASDMTVANYIESYRSNGSFFDELNDSLSLTRQILPDLLPLLNLDEYERPLMRLMGRMIDSSQLSTTEYSAYFSKFFLEARMELRKTLSRAMVQAMEKARKEQEGDQSSNSYRLGREVGSGSIPLYLRLLLPFREEKPSVQQLIDQIWKSGEMALQFDIMEILIENSCPVPDSLIERLAADDLYRYRLYRLLKREELIARFPKAFASQMKLALARLYDQNQYNRLDSVVYLDKLPVKLGATTGYVYFFKYREQKNNSQWKIGSVGLVPEQGIEFEKTYQSRYRTVKERLLYSSGWDELSDERFRDDEPVKEQLQKRLRQLEVGLRRSGRQFYFSNYRNYMYDR